MKVSPVGPVLNLRGNDAGAKRRFHWWFPRAPGRLLVAAVGVVAITVALPAADESPSEPAPTAEEPANPEMQQQQRVDVNPTVDDEAIAGRLTRILRATGWYQDAEVRVDEGVVFLQGRAGNERQREWATRLASNTESTVAVVNQMELVPRSMWDMSGTWAEIRTLTRQAVRQSPLLILALLMLAASWLLGSLSSRGFRRAMRRRWSNMLLRTMVGNAVGVLVFIVGLYFVLRISGLTRLAVTVLGGTGLMGLVVGFAFRDIAENFLASLLMSIQRPFATGDLIEVAGIRGYVQQVNSRSTLLMTFDGNHVQIPNATVYKEEITNFWANPQMRCSFTVGIGYDDSISRAQSLGVSVMRQHPAVLADPEPSVLVESLGSATVNLRFWFWINVRTHSEIKVKSVLIRLAKRAYQEAGISLPDEAREIVFPHGVPVELGERRGGDDETSTRREPAEPAASREEPALSDAAEGGLASEKESIDYQAKHSRMPEGGRNLLDDADD